MGLASLVDVCETYQSAAYPHNWVVTTELLPVLGFGGEDALPCGTERGEDRPMGCSFNQSGVDRFFD